MQTNCQATFGTVRGITAQCATNNVSIGLQGIDVMHGIWVFYVFAHLLTMHVL